MGHTGVIVYVVLCLVVILLEIPSSTEGTDADSGNGIPSTEEQSPPMYDDVNIPKKRDSMMLDAGNILDENDSQIKRRRKWVGIGGTLHTHREVKSKDTDKYVEIASSKLLPKSHENVGAEIISLMVRNMPNEVFTQLARHGSVGLFTAEESTTIFPEYAHLADTRKCKGKCDGDCSNTCTGDGRKYDSLAGLGGRRATCLDDNYMCTDRDPYGHTDNILVHEFAHTIHQYGLPFVYYNKIYTAYQNARDNINTWTPGSYAMSNSLEYFAEAAGIFFNVNHHWSSSGKMNRCGNKSGFCKTERQARKFLKKKDPMIYEVLLYTFTNNRPTKKGGLKICQSK